VEGLNYRPRTAETRSVYELMLAAVHTSLGDQPQDMVRSATDLVLEYLKSDDLKDFDKKREIESLVGPITAETFSQLISLGKKITDYGAEEEDDKNLDDEKADAIDEEVGVAVVFEDEEEEEDGDGFEINSDGSDDDEEEEDPDAMDQDGMDVPAGEGAGSDTEEPIVIGGAKSSKSTSGKGTDFVSALEIDGFWLQRLVAQSYADPQEAAEKTTAAMTLLSSEGNIRDVENALMDLTDYDKFALVSMLITNRDKIVWCTKLARSDENEKLDVEVAMREKNVGWILKELAGDSAKTGRKNASGMDVDDTKIDRASLKGNLAPGAVAPPPRKTVDLEAMAFSQGARLMSNKKCKLPEGSFKRTKKGYEEVHVPAPKPAPMKEGELVPVSSLPAWAQPAFKGNANLNRVQSRLYPIAFGTDEPILLCAPTGAGKVSSSAVFLVDCH
jgi:pre-mRNA-splicing helicase BRR2